MLGWLIISLKRNLTPRLVAISLLLASGAMILVSLLELIPTALRAGMTGAEVSLWFFVGVGVVLTLRALAEKIESTVNELEKSALLVAIALTLHNIPEGSVAISAAIVDLQSGIISAIAISLHNIPEGLAIAVTAVAASMKSLKVFVLVLIATLAEMSGAVLVFLESTSMSVSIAAKLLTVVAGIMMAVTIAELIPHGLKALRNSKSA